jgi:hypothetical protein
MNRCPTRCIVLSSVLTIMTSGCTGGTTAPSTREVAAQSARGNLEINSMGVTDAGQGAPGDWQYRVRANLRETAGVDMTVTNIQIQARLGANILATASVIPELSVSAYSSRDTELVFAAGTHIDPSALTVEMTVQFGDANGNTGSVNSSFSCFGCWDY